MVNNWKSHLFLDVRIFLPSRYFKIFKIDFLLIFFLKYKGFLTGVLQTHARKDNIAIDQLQFMFKILDFDK